MMHRNIFSFNDNLCNKFRKL